MTPEAPDPSGGLPWSYAGAIGTTLLGGIGALWARLWLRDKAHDKAMAAKDALLAAGVAAREELRREKDEALEKAERRADDLEKQIQAFLQEQLDRAHAQLRGTERPQSPPPGIVRQKHTTQVLFDEFRKVAERLRREGPPMDATQDA